MFGKPDKPSASSSKEAVGFLSGAAPTQAGDTESVASEVQALVDKYGHAAVMQAVQACEPETPAEDAAEPGEEAPMMGE